MSRYRSETSRSVTLLVRKSPNTLQGPAPRFSRLRVSTLTSIPQHRRSKRAQDSTLLGGVKVLSFNVEQYYRGNGASTVNIFTDGSDDYPFIDETNSYVLYLHEADFEAARAYYDDAYVIVAAGQGTWVVDDGRALQQSGAGESVELSNFESH